MNVLLYHSPFYSAVCFSCFCLLFSNYAKIFFLFNNATIVILKLSVTIYVKVVEFYVFYFIIQKKGLGENDTTFRAVKKIRSKTDRTAIQKNTAFLCGVMPARFSMSTWLMTWYKRYLPRPLKKSINFSLDCNKTKAYFVIMVRTSHTVSIASKKIILTPIFMNWKRCFRCK